MNVEALYRQYEQDGYVVIPAAMQADDLRQLQDTTDRIAAQAQGLSEENSVFDFEAAHTPQQPLVQRIKKPHRVDPLYFATARYPAIYALVQRICGSQLRLSHSKINMKAAKAGSPLEWHQDWAFAPHTNMCTTVASVMLDDTSVENGAMRVLPGSHRGPLLEHHDPELGFIGAVDLQAQGVDVSGAVPLEGPAGTISLHHPMTLHGSGANRSGRQRRILFLEYAAADAFPLFYNVDWDEYNSRLLSGLPTSAVRTEPNVIKLPFPSRMGSSIYKAQAQVRARYFETAV